MLRSFPILGSTTTTRGGGFSLPLRTSLVGSDGRTATFARASAAWYEGADGLIHAVASGAPRLRADRGVLVEEARTNRLLWSRDLTNAAWAKVSVTVAKNVTGADGAANSASRVTATAAGAGIFQTIGGLSSAVRTGSVWLRRISGSATMTMTFGGASHLVTLTDTWQRFAFTLGAASTNGQMELWLGEGMVIGVDFAQVEDGTFATSPMESGATPFARAADVLSVSTAGWPVERGSVSIRYCPLWSSPQPADVRLVRARTATPAGWDFWLKSGALGFYSADNGSGSEGAVPVTTWAAGSSYALRAAWGGGVAWITVGGVAIGSVSGPVPSALPTTAEIGTAAGGTTHFANAWLADLEVS